MGIPEMAFLEQLKFLQDSEDRPLTVAVSSDTMEFCVEGVVGKFCNGKRRK